MHTEYKALWGYMPNPQDFVCSQQEYIDALNKSITNKKELSEILLDSCKNLKNKALISKLKNEKNIQTPSSAVDKKNNRKDTIAVTNLERIKTGGEVSAELEENKVIQVVNSIRTVQSNKNLKKTRKTVIVRQNNEHIVKSFVAKLFNLLSFALVGIVAIVFGIFAGNMYIASKTLVSYDYDENDFLPTYATVYSQNSTRAPDKVSAVDAYIMAEWALMKDSGLLDSFSMVGNGTVSAKVGGINQQQVVAKKITKNSEIFTSESVTNGLIPAAEIYEYNYTQNIVKSYFSKQVSGTPPTATYGTDPYAVYNLFTEEKNFRSVYGIKADGVFAPIVSDKTVTKSSFIEENNGEYKYQITLDNVYSVINYVYLMMHMSGLERPPTFHEITITFTLDENYRFTEVYFFEKYQIYYLGLPAECTAETTYIFEY